MASCLSRFFQTVPANKTNFKHGTNLDLTTTVYKITVPRQIQHAIKTAPQLRYHLTDRHRNIDSFKIGPKC